MSTLIDSLGQAVAKYLRRVEDPSDSVVDSLAGGECLVTTFVGNDPKSGGGETGAESVKRPERTRCNPVEGRMR